MYNDKMISYSAPHLALLLVILTGAACATIGETPSTAVAAFASAPQPEPFSLPGDGIAMQAQLFLPEGSGPFSAVLVIPGGRGAAEIGKVWGHHVAFAHAMTDHGIAALVLDYHSSERALQDLRTISDIGVAVDHLKGHAKIRRDQIFLVGFSMGGTNALRVAGSRSDIAGLVTYFSPVDWSLAGVTVPPGVTKQPIEYAANLTCPVLILQGDRDEITSVEQARHFSTVLKAQGKHVELIIYPGAGHGFTYVRAPKAKCCEYDSQVAASAFEAVRKFVQERPPFR
jgi:carboxymethylenebutenolidase